MKVKDVTGSLTALNSTVVIGTDDADYVSVQLTGTWSGTVTFETTVNGVDWVSMRIIEVSDNSKTGKSTTTANGVFVHECFGLDDFRVRFSSYSSGTATVNMHSSRLAK